MDFIQFHSTFPYNIIISCIMSRGKNHIFLSFSSGRSSRASSKSATIEMYVGSNSYNETLSGETLGSLSDKSDTFFTSEHRHNLKVGVVVVKVFPSFPVSDNCCCIGCSIGLFSTECDTFL